MSASDTKRIAELNDQLRSRAGIPVFGEAVPGTIMMTRGIMSLTPEQIILIWAKVRNFQTFTEGNDPFGEHDFGSFTLSGVGKIFWKIDCFSDHECKWASECPSDPSKSYRVLTIMLAEEY